MKAPIASRRFLLAPTLGLLLAVLAAHVSGQDPTAVPKPGINDHFKNPDLKPEEWVGRFETESREVYAHRQEIVKASGVQPGLTVADIGAGTGLFTMLFADAVGDDGKVFAVEIAEPFVENLRKRAAAAGKKNVEPILGTDKVTNLPENSVDLAFICDTYHHFEHPQETLASIHSALKPGGLIVLVDFERIPGKSSDWTLNHVRAGKEVFVKEIEDAGFKMLEGGADFLEENYLVRLRKK